LEVDCDCNVAFRQVLDCVQMKGFSANCAGPLLGLSDLTYLTDLVACSGGCTQQGGPCPNPMMGDGGMDGSKPDAAQDGGGGG
jgi:hypothetical protein